MVFIPEVSGLIRGSVGVFLYCVWNPGCSEPREDNWVATCIWLTISDGITSDKNYQVRDMLGKGFRVMIWRPLKWQAFGIGNAKAKIHVLLPKVSRKYIYLSCQCQGKCYYARGTFQAHSSSANRVFYCILFQMNHSPKFDEAPRKLTPDRCSIPAEVASMIIKKCYTRHSNDEECSDTPSSPGRPKYFCYLGRSPDRARTKWKIVRSNRIKLIFARGRIVPT